MRQVNPFQTRQAPEDPTEGPMMTDEKLTEMFAAIERVDERTKRTEEVLDKVVHTLFEGNGQPPVLSQVATLNSEVTALKVAAAERRIPMKAWLGFLGAALGSPFLLHLLHLI